MIKVAICDDDIQFIYKLEQSIFRFAEMKRIKVDVDGYTSGAEFIQKLQQSERYDLLFLDIELLLLFLNNCYGKLADINAEFCCCKLLSFFYGICGKFLFHIETSFLYRIFIHRRYRCLRC